MVHLNNIKQLHALWLKHLVKIMIKFILIFFPPNISMTVIPILFAVAALLGLKMRQNDVKTTFLISTLEHENFFEQPRSGITASGEHIVCTLNECIYGLK